MGIRRSMQEAEKKERQPKVRAFWVEWRKCGLGVSHPVTCFTASMATNKMKISRRVNVTSSISTMYSAVLLLPLYVCNIRGAWE